MGTGTATRQRRAALRATADALVDEDLVERLFAQVDEGGVALLGPDGLLSELTRRLLERGLDVELTSHLGYERGDPGGRGSGNSRNGTTPKTLLTDAGPVELDVPRDRNSSFEPRLVPKGERRLDGFNEMIIGLTAKGLSARDVADHLRKVYGSDVSAQLVSDVTDAVMPELKAWQNRPLDPVYPILYLDAIVIKVRENHQVINKAAHLALGVDVEGRKHVLGCWLQQKEGAGFWLGVLTELKNRGVADVLIVCCDGLTGFPAAIEATWPQATVQTCVVHLVRNSVKYCSWKDRKAVVNALKPIYTAATIDAAADALDTFEIEYGDRYPAIVELWRRNWERFIPFLAFPPRSARSSTPPTPSRA